MIIRVGRAGCLGWRWAPVVVAVCTLTAAAWGQESIATRPAAPLPVLAMLMVTDPSVGDPAVEDILLSEMASQAYMRLVDRSELKKVLQEHSLSLAGLAERNNAAQLGKITGAEFLLFVTVSNEKAAGRLVEVSSGKVLMEDHVKLRPDLPLAAAALREKTLAALKLTPEKRDRLTVGIAAFPNRSGTDRSDKLGLELQKALRARLQQEKWAVVLEREYPTGLLAEVELTRVGLAKGTADQLPPADLVITGTMEDVTRQYSADKPWEIKLELTIRLHAQSVSEQLICQSDRIESAADEVVNKIIARRQRPSASQPAETEKEYWRLQALRFMPRSSYQVGRGPFDCMSDRQKLDAREAIRAWENLLLLDSDDVDARMNLGICLVSLYCNDLRLKDTNGLDRKRVATEQCLRGSRLVEDAVRARPDRANCVSFYFVTEHLRVWLPQRSAEMFGYMVANPDRFSQEVRYARLALARLQTDPPFDLIDMAVRDVDKDPDMISMTVFLLENRAGASPDKVLAFAAKHTGSPNPLVRFYFEWLTANILLGQKDADALEHFDKAIAAHEGAFAACSYNRLAVDDIYHYKIAACEALGKREQIRKTALDGVKHFLAVGRFNQSIQRLYCDCVTNILTQEGDEKEALAICDAYLAASAQDRQLQNNYLPQVVEKREELTLKLAGKSMPGFDNMVLVKGTETDGLAGPRMTVADGKVWIAWQPWQSGGPAMVYIPGQGAAKRLTDLPADMRSVAAVGKSVFFGGWHGLYKLNTSGEVLKHFSKADNTLPSDSIVDLREGDGKLYMSFRESDRYGVAVLDVDKDVVTVLAPSSRQANLRDEPVYDVYRLWWDGANSRLYANYYLRYAGAISDPAETRGWMQRKGGWDALDGSSAAARLIGSDKAESLQVTCNGGEAVFTFLKSGKSITCPLPLPWLIGEPAWDDKRIWVPGFMGLYEIDRASGDIRLVAHQTQNPCLDIVRLDGELYVATRLGLYRWSIPKQR